MKTVSFIIVNYNGRKFLSRLLDSIRCQTLQDFEVIFVDNDSKDDSVEFVGKNYPEVKIIEAKNRGFGTSCNLGAKKASGKYLAFFNEDMYFPRDFLEKILQFRQSAADREKTGGISCKMIDFDADSNDVAPTFGAVVDIFGFPVRTNDSKKTFIISASPCLIARDLFWKVRGFNESIFIYGEDVDLSWRLNIFGYKNYTCNTTYLHHFGGASTGGLKPKKVADIIYGSFIPIFSNYHAVTLSLIAPLYLIAVLLFCIFISTAKLDANYAREIGKKLIVFLRCRKTAMAMRRFVQKNRTRSDFRLLNYLSIVPAFFANKSFEKLHEGYMQKNY